MRLNSYWFDVKVWQPRCFWHEPGLASPSNPDDEVQNGQPCRKAALLCSAVALAVSAVGPVASGIAAATKASAVPSKLVGVWTRTVTFADAQRAGAGIGFVGDHCTLTIKKSGRDNASVLLGPAGTLIGDVVSAGKGRVHIQLGPATSVYRWKVAGRLLTLTKISDPNLDRVAVLVGVWKRK